VDYLQLLRPDRANANRTEDTPMSLELVRKWARVETWRDLARWRDRALHVLLSHNITTPEPADEMARFAVAVDESRFCSSTLRDLEQEHLEIMQFIEREAPELLGSLPQIPEDGPTPEDALSRAQFMASLLGSFLSREQGKAHPDRPSQDRQNDVITAIRNAGTPLTRSELVKEMGLGSEGKLGKNLTWMVNQGLLQKTGRGYWPAADELRE
jgi:hypothetical protein